MGCVFAHFENGQILSSSNKVQFKFDIPYLIFKRKKKHPKIQVKFETCAATNIQDLMRRAETYVYQFSLHKAAKARIVFRVIVHCAKSI